METQNIYQDTLKQLQEEFREEAVSFLPAEQVEKILHQEKIQIEFAEQQHIPLPSWMGNNLRRYCKDLLRRQQPFFALYYLLGVCTEASIVLFLCYGIYTLLHSRFPDLSFSVIPGILLIYFCGNEWNRSAARRNILHNRVPKNVHKVLHVLIPALVVSLGSILFWDRLLLLYHSLNLQNTFLLCAVLLFLSGIHNVLYSSHVIPFMTIGILSCRRHLDPEKKKAVTQYLDNRTKIILAERRKTQEQMQADPKLYADVTMSIRSQLITYRIYLLFALLLLIAFDILCIYQGLHTHAISMLILGSITALVILLLAVCMISCNEIIRHLTKN
ncbi:MAG: hypothetical protein K2J67_10630 [Lachnospiraceae bacterium]|nr:hypothetical protein [Lachnospiraceae bacterium]